MGPTVLDIANNISAASSREELAAVLQGELLHFFYGNFISVQVSGQGRHSSAHLFGDIPVPANFYRHIASTEMRFYRFSAIGKIEGGSSYTSWMKRKKITHLMAGALPLTNDLTITLCVYYAGETNINKERRELASGYLRLIGTTVNHISFPGRMQREAWDSKPAGHVSPAIVGDSKAMAHVFRLIGQVASSDATVLLTGETGTGKELVAEAIHQRSGRGNGPLVKLNCAAIPSTLIESELFGHEKGSFTGALSRRIGKFELAHGGTLLLDEIGEMPLDTQVRLLRVLQEKEIERIGGNKRIKTDVRVIASTNRDLREEVRAGRFRSDLYHRLNVFPIFLPPLRQRKEDIPALAILFIEQYAKKDGKKPLSIQAKAMRQLMDYSFPGNVRELEHIMHRTLLLTNGEVIKQFHLPAEEEHASLAPPEFVIQPLKAVEREYILKAVKACGGRISGPQGAAVKLGLPPTTLISRMEKLGIKKGYASA